LNILAISVIIRESEQRGMNMIVNSTEIQNNFGKYLDIASGQEVIITKNGLPVARLLGMKGTVSFLSDRLVGIIPRDVDEDEVKSERLARQ
jgi:prevent-host-death family protein